MVSTGIPKEDSDFGEIIEENLNYQETNRSGNNLRPFDSYRK